jgi:hypothetical protein|tara:strand:- start:1853 stop:1975 length:123 start_codon:yes stop_codon:yes gene_type:complete
VLNVQIVPVDEHWWPTHKAAILSFIKSLRRRQGEQGAEGV